MLIFFHLVHYFNTTAEINALPNDVNNNISNGVSHIVPEDNYLYFIGNILKEVHKEYYSINNNNNNNNSKDVKVIYIYKILCLFFYREYYLN